MNKIFKYLCGGLLLLGGVLLPTKAVADVITMTTTASEVKLTMIPWYDNGTKPVRIVVSFGDGQKLTMDVLNTDIDTTITHSYISQGEKTITINSQTRMFSLTCGNNQLTSIDVSNATGLSHLYCDHNQLTSLDVSNNRVLVSLECNNNQLTFLDLSTTSIGNLVCDSNAIASLQLRETARFGYCRARGNRLPISILKELSDRTYAGVNDDIFLCHPQRIDKVLTVGENWDLTSEMTIDGTVTAYTLTDEAGASVPETACVEQDGVFRFRQSGKYVLTLTNSQVLDLVKRKCSSSTGECEYVNVSPIEVIYEVTVSGTDIMVYTVEATPNAAVGGTVSPSGSQRYESGEAVTLTATPSEDYVFVHWADAAGKVVSTENPYTFAVTSDMALTAVFRQIIHYTLAVTASDGGTVSQSGSGVYEAGDEVTLTATPSEDYVFVHWADAAGKVVSTENPYTFAVTSDMALTAVFRQIIHYTLVVTASDGGTVSQSGSGVYEAGDEVTITATPSEDYVFMHWVDAAGKVVSTENPYTFAVTSDMALTAVFRQIIHYTLVVTASNGGTVSQSGSGIYEAGDEVTVTATPSEDYVFVHWADAAGEVVSTENPYTFAVTSDMALTAVFRQIIHYTLVVTASNGGTVSPSGSGIYEAGDEVTVTATPSEDYVFVHWADADGKVVSTENPYTFTVTSDMALTAVFRQIIHYTLAVTASEGGTASQSGNGIYEAGDEVTLTATPSAGYRFVNWERVTEQTVFATEAEYTFQIMENLMLKANFVKEGDRPGDTTAIEDLTVGAAMVYVKAHTIYVADNTAEVRVYTNGGMCVYRGYATEIPVRQSGVYVVWLGDRRVKVLVP